MHSARALAAALLVLLTLSAGCLSGKGSEPADPAATDGDGAPVDGEGGASAPVDDGSSRMPDDLGHMPHLHDYWAGKERVTLFDGDVAPTPEDGATWTVYQAWIEKQPGKAGGAYWRLPDGATVFEGTGELDITASWDDPLVTGLAVSYKAGSAGEFGEPVPLESGRPLVVAVTPEMTDMPHMTVSRWEFMFFPEDAPGAALGAFHLRVEIVKMRDIAEFPGHPLLFEGKPEKVVFDAPGKSAQVSYAKRIPNLVLTGAFGEHEITPSALVPMETLAMRAEVLVTKADASVGEVAEIRFFWHGADSTNLQRVLPKEGSMAEKRYVFEWPVAMENTDSPYAPGSQWRLMVEAATSVTGEDPTCGGCVDTDIEFHLLVTAYDHLLDGMDAAAADGEAGEAGAAGAAADDVPRRSPAVKPLLAL